jgi:hypothetical protein
MTRREPPSGILVRYSRKRPRVVFQPVAPDAVDRDLMVTEFLGSSKWIEQVVVYEYGKPVAVYRPGEEK